MVNFDLHTALFQWLKEEHPGVRASIDDSAGIKLSDPSIPVPSFSELEEFWQTRIALPTAIALKKTEIREAREEKLKVTTWGTYQFQTDKDSRDLLAKTFIFVEAGKNPPPWKMLDNSRVKLSRTKFLGMANFVFSEAEIFFDIAFDLIDRVEGLAAIDQIEAFDDFGI